MRFTSLLLPLVLLLTIGSISADTLMSGRWSNPYTSNSASSYCCIPTSIEIQREQGEYTAYYKYPNSISSKCWNLFLNRDNGSMKLYKNGSTSYTESAYSETTFYGSMKFNFFATNTTGSPRLNINAPSSSGCDFTMYTRVDPTTDGIASFIIGSVLACAIAACCRYKKYQKDKESRESARDLALQQQQEPIVVTSYTAPPIVYAPPSDAEVAQGIAQQKLYTPETAPGQFPENQVNNTTYGGYN